MLARIYEQGNGFPDTGDFVAGRGDWEGGVFVVTGESSGPIQTGDERGNWLLVEVEEADWFDIPEGNECFPALCVPVHPGTSVEVQPPADYVADYLKSIGRGWLVWTDVHQLFYLCPGLEADALAEWLVAERPDLVDEVQDVLAELRGVSE